MRGIKVGFDDELGQNTAKRIRRFMIKVDGRSQRQELNLLFR